MNPVVADRTLTYSPAYTLVPTYECFNRCSYCNFRVDPGEDEWMTEAIAISRLEALQNSGVIEILILSGEVHPHSPRRSLWFDRIYRLAELAVARGFLPHTNAGILHRWEMEALRSVNVSLGLMLEEISPKVDRTVHRHAPSKTLSRRLEQLRWAGELRIPLTTGLLLGIGETPEERVITLETIAQVHQEWGHIQEVILQPYRPGTHQSTELPGFDLSQLPTIVSQARSILPREITLQVPPNLILGHQAGQSGATLPFILSRFQQEPLVMEGRDLLLRCLDAGVRDLGGLVPLDEVNPDYEHPSLADLTQYLGAAGWHLTPRLPLYPPFYSWSTIALRDKLPANFPATSPIV